MFVASREKLTKLSVFITIFVTLIIWFKIFLNYSTYEDKIFPLEPNTKFILLWTLPTRDPVKYLGHGKESFKNRKCPSVNCYVSFNRMLLGDVAKFDVIIFHSSDININDLPTSRASYQKYVFASMESADNYPMCNRMFDNFFNWTWTYKLNSDVLYPYISIKDSYGNVIGPKEIMSWKRIEDMDPINDNLKEKLSKKKKAAAWFVSHCESHSKREVLVRDLQREMLKYDLQLDVYGECSSQKCPRSDMAACLQMLQEDYYFYLSFENSLSEDYVTEKLSNALRNYVVPIVFGGANYTRFIPDGTYLDAKQLRPAELAAKMHELITDKEQYYSYFKWHNHYSYHEPTDFTETDPYCNLCSTINEKLHENSEYIDFYTWWTTSETCVHYNFNSYLSLI